MKTDLSEIRWLRGALYGVMTYVTALLFSGMWFYFDHFRTPIRASATTQQRIGMGVGTFYEGQFVETGEQFFRIYGTGGHGLLFDPMYQLIPVVVILFIAGVFVYTETDTKDRLGAFLSGASLAPGYVVLSLIVVLAFRSLAGPKFLPIGTAVVFGLLYPAVLGGVSGLVATEVKGYMEEEESSARSIEGDI